MGFRAEIPTPETVFQTLYLLFHIGEHVGYSNLVNIPFYLVLFINATLLIVLLTMKENRLNLKVYLQYLSVFFLPLPICAYGTHLATTCVYSFNCRMFYSNVHLN